MNKDIFNDPTEFDPSRFENPSKPIPPFAYVPFGGGPHTCIGNEFARVETLSVIHHLVTKFEWSLVNPEEQITRLALPYPSMGLPIYLKPKH
ncbi:Cytochrome P450 [Macleaya cordata]|uniref:Cytochrome P450 n=1 Tax=Macleaya cordata TaxID=56857 RepID=A0A200R3I1_MACCD|nr:Cytochrome P450 [Macleaya cordata]